MENYDLICLSENCTCGSHLPEYNIEYSNNSTSSENEEDYYSYIKVEIENNEVSELFKVYNPLLNPIKPFLNFYDNRMRDLIHYWEPSNFFVSPNGKFSYLFTLPYSYMPLLKKPIDLNDVICAPSYLSKEELYNFTKVFDFNDYFIKRYKDKKEGFSFFYDIEKKEDLQSLYIYQQRLFYQDLVKDRLINKKETAKKKENQLDENKKKEEEEEKKKIDKNKDVEYNLPVISYEPNTFIKRFCDLFAYLCASLDQLYLERDEDENLIKKLSIGIYSGFHLVLASQGIPLTGLIGETYTVENTKTNCIMYAEVKNDKPLKIVYNIRWKERIIMLDGDIDFSWDFNENKDEFVINTMNYNTLRIKNSKNKNKLYTFNLPLKIMFSGIVDTIDKRNERIMTISSFVYIKGDEASALTAFNYPNYKNLYDKFFGFLSKSIINLNETLYNGHSFVTIIFHNSGLSFENVEGKEEFQQFLQSKSFQIENFKKKQDNNIVKDRFGCISYLNFKDKEVDKDENSKKDNEHIEDINNNFENIDQVSNDNKSIHENNDLVSNTPSKNIKEEKYNKNPKRKHHRIFKRLVLYLTQIFKSDRLNEYFSPSFVRKLVVGSWSNLNFYEINYNSSSTNEMLPVYLKFDKDAIRVYPTSRFNEKKGLRIVNDDMKFFKGFYRVFGNLWTPVEAPLITDTRYREDLGWLTRYYERLKMFDKSKEDELNNMRKEAFINAKKYKELIESYVHVNISNHLNRKKK